MDLTEFGWRDGLLLAIALAAVYLVVALLGLARLRRRHDEAVAPPAAHRVDPPDAAAVANGNTSDEPPPFAAHLALTELEAKVQQLHAEVTAMREEMAALKVAPRVSPLYADAAALAKRGFDARGVADECGISVAEAELVLAMSRDEQNYDSEVNDDRRGHDVAPGLAGR
jgi:hypothetical protein